MRDAKWITKIKKGDLDAFRYLYEEYYHWLCVYLYNLSHNKQLSEDLVHDVFIKLWDKREKILITTSIKSYLFRTCHNEFLQELRKNKRRQSVLDKIRIDKLYAVFEEEAKGEKELKYKKLEKLIAQLPPRCREIFVKSKLHRLKYKEIADELGISIKTVETQMSKALHILRKHAS
ncbi:MAG: RNA polymerase sigma-70 factor [Flavobacteriaceae bacterium]|nr:RNA polymerase sigma-70 factor [Flavobacteriaceae bacterium]